MTKADLLAVLATVPDSADIIFDLGEEYADVASAEAMDAGPHWAVVLCAPQARYTYNQAEDTRILEV